MWEESELIIEGIDTDNLTRYLSIHMKKEEIIEEGFEELIYRKEPKQRKTKVKVTKKVGRKHVNSKAKKQTKDSQNDKVGTRTHWTVTIVRREQTPSAPLFRRILKLRTVIKRRKRQQFG